jgi:hypothetical protein
MKKWDFLPRQKPENPNFLPNFPIPVSSVRAWGILIILLPAANLNSPQYF